MRLETDCEVITYHAVRVRRFYSHSARFSRRIVRPVVLFMKRTKETFLLFQAFALGLRRSPDTVKYYPSFRSCKHRARGENLLRRKKEKHDDVRGKRFIRYRDIVLIGEVEFFLIGRAASRCFARSFF